MIKKLLFLAIFTAFLPVFASAQCSNAGETVVFVNGIFSNKRDAEQDALKLQDAYKSKIKNKNTVFFAAFNASHLQGVGDLVKSTMQAYVGTVEKDYDLINVLRQIHRELKTQKMLLVGHSQGTFYTNAAYDYLIKNGVQQGSVSVYNVATPADRVAGGGNYLTSDTDKLINTVVRRLIELGHARRPLAANISIPLDAVQQVNELGGHSFSDVYLKGAPDRIIGDIQKALNNLSTSHLSTGNSTLNLSTDRTSSNSGCFVPPIIDLAYNVKKTGFEIGDGFAGTISSLGRYGFNVATTAYRAIRNIARYLPASLATARPPQNISAITYVPPLKTLPPTDHVPIVNLPNPNDRQYQIDQMLEKIDVIRAQLAILEKAEREENQLTMATPKIPEVKNPPKPVTRTATTSTERRSGTRTAPATPIYSKLLISEVQMGGTTDEKEEFVELYNPNNESISLTGWYVQRKTKTADSYSSYATSTVFAGTSIAANGYFLIARTGYFAELADIFIDNSLTEDNTLVLKNPNGEIVDVVGWGQAQDFETAPTVNHVAGQSIGRGANEQDTDNNALDFKLNIPTPKAVNRLYNASPPPPAEPLKNILINEIQTYGADEDDQFIELYNPNGVPVDMKNYNLAKKTSSGTESNLVSATAFSGTIAPHGFFVIVPKGYSGKAAANLTYSGATFSLAEKNNTVILYNAQKVIVDKVGFGEAHDFETAAFNCSGQSQCIPRQMSIERKKLGLDTDNNASDFKLSDTPTPSESFPVTQLRDTTVYPMSMGNSSPGTIHYEISLEWSSPSQNIDFYQVQQKKGDGSWMDWQNPTTQTKEKFFGIYSLLNDNLYSFRARATDADGNTGSWSPEVIVDLRNFVLISEVDSVNKWVELYNRSDFAVNLAGWKLGNTILTGALNSHEYLVVENISLDSSLLRLSASNGRQVDEVLLSESTGNATLERVSMYSFGREKSNWLSSTTSGGTPGAANSNNQKYTFYTASFMEDTILPASLSPYVFSGEVHVGKDMNLTIEPGVTIKFFDERSRLVVHGTFRAVGDGNNNIAFTSWHDDSIGGDTNGDESETMPRPGDWLGIHFAADSANSSLEYALLRYGGGRLENSWGAAAWIDRVPVSITSSVFEYNLNRALLLVNSDTTVDSSQFAHNSEHDFPADAMAIEIRGGSPHIIGNSIADSAKGIVAGGNHESESVVLAHPTIHNNIISKTQIPISWHSGAILDSSGNIAEENDVNAILINAGALDHSLTFKPDLPYLIKTAVNVPQNTALAIEPGVIVEFHDNHSGLQIDGTLKAAGAADNHIVFRSLRHNDPQAAPGMWKGLHFSKTSVESSLDYVSITHAGALRGDSNVGAGIHVDHAPITLTNAALSQNANAGIWLVNSPSTIDDVHFINDGKGVRVQGGAPSIKNSLLKDNNYGFYIDDLIDADGNVIPANPTLEGNEFENNGKDVHWVK